MSNDRITVTADITLYAQWKKNDNDSKEYVFTTAYGTFTGSGDLTGKADADW